MKRDRPAVRREARYEEIINTAALMFAEKGSRDATIHDIACELGMTGAAIYYYVDSKDQLLYEIWKRAGRKLQDGVDAERASSGRAVEKLRRVFHRHLDVIISNRPIFEVLILQRSRLPELGREDLIDDERVYVNTIVGLISEIPGDQLRVKEPRIFAMGIISMLNGVIRWYGPDQRLNLDELADIYFDMFTHGVLREK